jgi:hypothetical protein
MSNETIVMNEQELSIDVKKTATTELVVMDQQSFEVAGAFLTTLKSKMKQVTEFFAESKKKAAEAHKAICANESALLNPLKDAESQVKAKMSAYLAAEEAKRRAEEERQAKEAEKMMALAAEATACGDDSMAEEATMEAALQSVKVSCAPKAAGISSRKIWKFRIVDKTKVPAEFMIVNEAAISGFCKTFKDSPTIEIAGIEFYTETQISARAR